MAPARLIRTTSNMKIPSIFRPAAFGLAFVLTTSATVAQAEYSELIDALQVKNRDAVSTFEEADLLMKGYQDYLNDPEIEAVEKPALRKEFLEQKARQMRSQNEMKQTRAAILGLVRLQKTGGVDPAVFKKSYEGLDGLAKQARGAWQDILSVRKELQSDLRLDYHTELLAAEDKLQGLKTRENLSKLLLGSVNFRSEDLDDNEFKTALKLPPLTTATAGGFGIGYQRDDDERHAQLVLFALTGYSNYFWDHFDKGRAAGEKEPAENHRNIFGAPDGKILLSQAVSHNDSNYYHLSDEARALFNSRVAKIWGKGSLQVKKWNQHYSDAFGEACLKLSISSEDGTPIPSDTMVALVEEVDKLIKADNDARREVEGIRAKFRIKLAEAEEFGENVWLSTAAYNSSIWVKESKELLAGFEKARALLKKQNEQCLLESWKPDTHGIQKSVQIIERATQRHPAVAKVRRTLEKHFEGSEKEAGEIPAPTAEELKDDSGEVSDEENATPGKDEAPDPELIS